MSVSLHGRQVGIARNLFQNKLLAPAVTFVVRRSALPLFVALALLIAGLRPLCAQASGAYRVDTKESKIEIHLFKGGFLSAFGDNHLIDMIRFSGTADLPENGQWKAELTAEAGSLKVVDPWGGPSERKEVQDTMLGPQQLDVGNFPHIALHSISFDPTGEDKTWHLVADVELHGVTRKVEFSLEYHQIGDKLRISGEKMFKLTDFNIQPFSTALGAVKVKNDFQVTYNIVLDPIP